MDSPLGAKGRGPIVASLRGMKGSFPFRLGTTSYILPAPIIPNLRFLAPYVDEVELVLFESEGAGNLPSPKEVRQMDSIAREHHLGYIVHLPTDLYLGDPEPWVRDRSKETILRFYRRTEELSPRAYVLHLERKRPDGSTAGDFESWMGRVLGSLEKLAREGVELQLLALENLDYGVNLLAKIAMETGTGLCIDVGHLLRYGFSLREELDPFLPRCNVLHIHGVMEQVDHRGLDAIEEGPWKKIWKGLLGFSGSVCVEVFSLEDLRRSMERIRGEAPWTS
jgi:sugar phosphate isomerase/epimerase